MLKTAEATTDSIVVPLVYGLKFAESATVLILNGSPLIVMGALAGGLVTV